MQYRTWTIFLGICLVIAIASAAGPVAGATFFFDDESDEVPIEDSGTAPPDQGAAGGDADMSAKPGASERPARMEEIVVTATRRKSKELDAPAATNVVTRREMEERATRSLPEALSKVPSVMVQKTSYGQGSPYIRGFTGFHNVILIDGVRLNNSTIRSGPNQYWNTIDPLTAERLEVVRGPSSVLYGSDAVGGTVNVITKKRNRYEPGFHLNGSLYWRWADAEDSIVQRVELEGNFEDRVGFFGGISYKNFGNLEAGEHARTQHYTGYDEYDGDMRFDFFLREDVKLTLAWQRVDQDEVPRTHKTIYAEPYHGTTFGSELRRELDQDRDLFYGRLVVDRFAGYFDSAAFTISSQRQEQVRDRLRTGRRRDISGFDVQTYGASFQLAKSSTLGDWTVGSEYYRDNVDSFRENYRNGALVDSDIQGPVGDRAEYGNLGIYAQNEKRFGALDLITGLRYNYISARADRVADPVNAGQIISVADTYRAVVGSLRAVYHLDPHWNLFGGVSQGFRAPNLSDLTSLDATSAVETPSPDLDPEYFVAFETGVRAQRERFAGQVALWQTMIDDMIVQSPTGNSVGGTPEVRKNNVGDGYVHGIEADLSWKILNDWTALGAVSWMDGEVDQFRPAPGFEKVEKPISRMMPLSGFVGLRFDAPSRDVHAVFETVMAAEQDELALRDATDTSRIPPGGTPGYTIFNIRAGWEVTEDLTLSAALENISNKNYRIHGSGINEPGRNLVLSVRLRF